jgi:thymidylate synthase
LEAYEFVYHLGNAHIYDDHIEPLREQVKRKPYDFPTIVIKHSSATSYKDICDYKVDDFIVADYKSYEPIKMVMRA